MRRAFGGGTVRSTVCAWPGVVRTYLWWLESYSARPSLLSWSRILHAPNLCPHCWHHAHTTLAPASVLDAFEPVLPRAPRLAPYPPRRGPWSWRACLSSASFASKRRSFSASLDSFIRLMKSQPNGESSAWRVFFLYLSKIIFKKHMNKRNY